MTCLLGNSVVECLHGKSKALCLNSGRPQIFTCYIWHPNIKIYDGEVVELILDSIKKNLGISWKNFNYPGKNVACLS